MGLLDVLTGKRKLAKPAPDRLFAMSTAYVTFETEPRPEQPRARRRSSSSRWPRPTSGSIVTDMEEVVRATAGDSGTTVETSEDSFGFSWLILRGPDFDELVVGLNAVSSALEAGGYGERLLCAVFAFQDSEPRARVLDLQLQARHLLPVRARRRASSSATTSASWSSRPRSAGAAGRGGARALVPALGHPDLSPPQRREPAPILLNRRAATRPTITGVERWTAEIIPRLQALDPERYAGRPAAPPPAATRPPPPRPGSSCSFRPAPPSRERPSIFSPANLAPLAWPRNVVVVHDLAVLRERRGLLGPLPGSGTAIWGSVARDGR